MRNSLILMVLITLAMAAPAVADSRRTEYHDRSGHGRIERDHHGYARHDRGRNYDHFQKKMKKLRKELRHERRENHRWERRVQRLADHRAAGRGYHYRYRSTPVVVALWRPLRPLFFPGILVQIPLRW